MPCRDYQDECNIRTVEIEVDNPVQATRVIELEAALCAIFNDLDRRGITKHVIDSASIAGGIDLDVFWNLHKLSDTARLSKDLSKYSLDEKDILRQILVNNKV